LICSRRGLDVLAAFQFVAELFETHSEFRTVKGCDVPLRNKNLVRLQRARLPVVPLRHVENHGMCVQLRCRVSVYWPRGVVLECSCDKLSGCFRGMYVSDACLRVAFELCQRRTHALPVCHSNPFVAAHKGGNRHRLGRGERRIPSGTMLDAGDFFTAFSLVGPRDLVPNELLAGLRMLALGQPRKVLVVDSPIEIPLAGELSLPFAVPLLVSAPVVLLLRSKFFGVVRPRLTGR